MEHACDKIRNMEGVKITGGLVPDKSTNHYYRMAWYLYFDQLWSSIEYCPYCGTKLGE